MKSTDQVPGDFRDAEIDLALLDSNLALTYEQRGLKHDEVLGKVRAYEKATGVKLPQNAIIRRTKSGIELPLKVDDGYDVKRIV